MEDRATEIQHGIQFLTKILIDRVVAICGLVVLVPWMVIIALVTRMSIGSPIAFRQFRPGRDGKPFRLAKFRTMSNATDSAGNLLPDADRLTKFGRFLRSTSLDELPQLWNVLRGDLSLVGPRPLLMDYLSRYSPEQARRHDVLPGITGWAQVNGRNAISWDEKLALDVWYVDNWSLWLDLRILCLTALRVIRRDGITQRGSATMSEFMGTQTLK
jgi:sugar transferase EpsL